MWRPVGPELASRRRAACPMSDRTVARATREHALEAERAVQEWIEQVLGAPFDAALDFSENLADGSRLCALVDALLAPGALRTAAAAPFAAAPPARGRKAAARRASEPSAPFQRVDAVAQVLPPLIERPRPPHHPRSDLYASSTGGGA